jgi:DNA-directed RNA polymerase subunit M/transcription elongation factor TFIIS
MIVKEFDSVRVSVICPKCGETVWVFRPIERLNGDESITSKCWKCKSNIKFVVKAWIE